MVDRSPARLTFTHTRLLVAEYTACVRFYRDVLGFELEWGDEDGVHADFRTGETTLALFDQTAMAETLGEEGTPSNRTQQDDLTLVFGVESVDDTYERLRDDVAFVTQPHDQPGWGIRVAHFRDPDGTLLEINEPLD